MTTVGGSTPNISVTFDVHDFGNTGGASGMVQMSYHLEYFNPGAAHGAQIVGTINTSNQLARSGSTLALTTLTINSAPQYFAHQCVSSGSCPAFDFGAPFVSGPITVSENVDYFVFLNAAVQTAGGFVGTASATIDPWFSAPAGDGGQFIFSPGITAFDGTVGVPGPVAGAGLPGLILASAGLLGWRRQRTASNIPASA
jgi:hypothetical protein